MSDNTEKIFDRGISIVGTVDELPPIVKKQPEKGTRRKNRELYVALIANPNQWFEISSAASIQPGPLLQAGNRLIKGVHQGQFFASQRNGRYFIRYESKKETNENQD